MKTTIERDDEPDAKFDRLLLKSGFLFFVMTTVVLGYVVSIQNL